MDRRLTPANARAALDVLRGQVDSPRFVPGEPACLGVPVADLLDAPKGNRDRQLLYGDAVTVIERHEGWAFVQAAKDGYCGYLADTVLSAPQRPTHFVVAAATHVYTAPRVQAQEHESLSFGSRVTVTDRQGKFAQTPDGFIPLVHLRGLAQPFTDPVEVAELFLGTPYLWGGNSRGGVDCSGLVQAALLACGIECPGDSDLQRASAGEALDADAPLLRGDLIFWRGHVAMVVDGDRLIHANGHSMSVAHEDIIDCIGRIARDDGLPVLQRRRPKLPR